MFEFFLNTLKEKFAERQERNREEREAFQRLRKEQEMHDRISFEKNQQERIDKLYKNLLKKKLETGTLKERRSAAKRLNFINEGGSEPGSNYNDLSKTARRNFVRREENKRRIEFIRRK